MFNLPGLSIRIESARSPAVQSLSDTDADENLHGPNAAFLVARLDGEAVGCIALVDQVAFGEARRLYVRESARGTGIAASLVTALEHAARDIGLRRLTLDLTASEPRARDTFSAAGYRLAAQSQTLMEKHL